MTIYQTAYDTTACAGYQTGKIRAGLQAAMVQGLLASSPYCGQYALVQGSATVDQLVTSFAHPMAFEHNGVMMIGQDVRPLGRWDSVQGEFVPRNRSEYDAHQVRGLLNCHWLQDPVALRSVTALPLQVYANWIGEAVAKRLALDARDQLAVSVLAGVLYLNLFWNQEELNTADKQYISSTLTRTLNFKAEMVADVVDAYPVIRSVPELCEAARNFTQSVRMRDLNASVLFAIVGGYWYGNNGRETIATALEHPPTWLALIYQALHDRGYHNTNLTKLLDRPSYKKQGQLYTLQLLNLVKPQR